LFKDLIQDWRVQLNHPELPFLFVQLANLEFQINNRLKVAGPNFAMHNAGRWKSRHRKWLWLSILENGTIFILNNKKEVAHRLALAAEKWLTEIPQLSVRGRSTSP
jgi:hypothetical protein